MKKIKLMAWDKDYKKMCIVNEISFRQKRAELYWFEKPNSQGCYWEEFENIDFLTYAGCEDKHGKEIYSGHIVKHVRVWEPPDNYNTGESEDIAIKYIRIGYITIRPSCGITLNGTVEKWDYHDDTLIEKVKYSGNPGCWSEYSEILGNKFQHSELLEKP